MLQELDSAAEAARRRLAELPDVEREIETTIANAAADVEAAKNRLTDNQQARRELEKQVAAVDARLSRFSEHKAAVKTNQEYTALLHEIATAKAEKDGLEEQLLVLMEAADQIAADVTSAEAAVAQARRQGDRTRAALGREQQALEADLERLAHDKSREAEGVDPSALAKYDQLLRQRKMVAVAAMDGETCTACHVRLRPAITQLVRRGVDLIQCDSCQRILYLRPAPADASPASQASPS